MMIRTYSELIKLRSFEERFQYLKLDGKVGKETFGFDRFLNQKFYMSNEWKNIRASVIFRDNGCDLGVAGHDIYKRAYVHHMNPISPEDLAGDYSKLLNPEYLITVTHNTHNAIHFGDANLLMKAPVERRKNDTCPWKM